MKYNYYDAVTDDIVRFLRENYSDEEIKEFDSDKVVDIVYNEDEVTGCDNGYDYPEVVADYVRDNLSFALECAQDCGLTLEKLVEYDDIYTVLDTSIRSFVLYECASEALVIIDNGEDNG